MTTAGGGLTDGDDYVALRLNLDIGQEGVAGVREITQEVERYRVAMEAAIRSEADMSRYADQMAESTKKAAEAQANLTQQLQTFMQLSGQVTGGGPQGSGVPQGPHKAPWEPGTAGTGASPVPPGARMPNPSDVVYQLGDKAGGSHKDAASYLNMQHGRGNVPDTVSISADSIQSLATQIAEREKATGKKQDRGDGSSPQRPDTPSQRPPSKSDPYDQFEDRVEGFSGLAKQVMNEMGTGKGFGHMALDGINYARKQLEQRAGKTNVGEKGGTTDDPNADPQNDGDVGNIAKGLGIAGGVLGVALAGYGLAQKGGQMIQGWRNIAGERGGAAGQGLQLSARADVLAMDPMIGQDQARQIYQAMLSEGYANASGSGGFGPNSAEDIKNFYKNGIKNWNMDVSEGTELLRLSAKGTKISLVELAQGMDQLKRQAALPGGLSLSDQKRMAMQYAAQLESQGVSPENAWKNAINSSAYFAQDPELQGSMMNPVGRNWGNMERMYGGPGGTPLPGMQGVDPRWTDEYLQETGGDQNASLEAARTWAKKFKQQYKDTSDNTKLLKKGDPGFTQWFNASMAFSDWLTTSGSQWAKLSGTAKRELYNQLCNDAAFQKIKTDAQEQIDKRTTELTPTEHKGPGVTVNTPFGSVGVHVGKSEYYSAPEQKIRDVFSDDQIKVVDESGKVSDFDPTNEQQAKDLGSGKLRWKRATDQGNGITIAETPEGINKDFTTDDPNNPAGKGSSDKSGDNKKTEVTGTLHIKVDKDGNVSAPSSVPLTANQDAANRGVGTAQVNNPPVGDGPYMGGGFGGYSYG